MTANMSTKERLLIVDDEPQIRELISRLLENDGYDCLTAASGPEAERLLAAEPCVLMLADLQMPGESGLDLISSVHETALATEEALEELEEGRNPHFDPLVIHPFVETLLEPVTGHMRPEALR